MKKKILMFLMATCFMIPCAFLLSACGGNGDKKPSEENAMPVTISFGLSPNWQFGEDWTIDSSTNTYTTTYGSCYWDEYMFNVVATTAEGNTKTMYEATESNPMGYKVDTNLPAEGTYNSNRGIPAGTYTYRLYIEDFNNGYYKAEACSSPTYTIVVNKKVVDCSDVKWVVGQTMEGESNEKNTMEYSNGDELNVYLTSENESFEMRDGIFNFQSYESTFVARTVGDYTARIDYDIDEANYQYINLPSKNFEWHITKANPMNYISGDIWGYYGPISLNWYGEKIEMSANLSAFQWHPAEITITGYEGTTEATKPGKYTCKPIFSQGDTHNFELINADDFILEWEVLPIEIDATSFSWNYNSNFGYEYTPDYKYEISINGTLYTGISIEYITDLPKNITKEATNAGKYTAKAKLNIEEGYEDYYVVKGDLPECKWEIHKIKYDTSEIEWRVRKTFGETFHHEQVGNVEYSGLVTTAVIYSDLEYTPFEVIRYETYDSNGELITSDITDIGRYTTKAIISYDKVNYELTDTSVFECNWGINYKVQGPWTISQGAFGTSTGWSGVYEIEAGNTQLTLTFDPDAITPSNDFTFKFYLDGELVEESALVLDASTPRTYEITVKVESQDSKLVDYIDESNLSLTIKLVFATE